MTETFEIKLSIHSESELYNSFDEDHQTISSDVIDYLYSRYQEKDLRDKLKVHIISDDSIDVEKLQAAFRCYLDSQRKTLAKERRKYCLLTYSNVKVIFYTKYDTEYHADGQSDSGQQTPEEFRLPEMINEYSDPAVIA